MWPGVPPTARKLVWTLVMRMVAGPVVAGAPAAATAVATAAPAAAAISSFNTRTPLVVSSWLSGRPLSREQVSHIPPRLRGHARGPRPRGRLRARRRSSFLLPPAERATAEHECAGDGEHQLHRLRPLELRLAGRPRTHVDRHLVDAQPRLAEPDQRLDLGRAREVRLCQELRGGGVRRHHPAGRVADRAAGADADGAPKDGCAEAARGRREVAVRGVAVARDEPRPESDVAVAGADELEEPPELGHRVLAVGVDAAAEPVAVLVRPCPSGGDGLTEAGSPETRGPPRPRCVRPRRCRHS